MKLADYISAARPILHIPIWSVYLVSLKYHHDIAGNSFSPVNLFILLGLSLIASGAYFLNQIFDSESDRINRKLGHLRTGLVTPRGLWQGFCLSSVAAFFIAVYCSWSTMFIYAQLFLLAYLYSAPPVRLKDRPLGGLLANAYSFGFLISLSVMPALRLNNAGLLGWDSPVYFFLSVAAIHGLTTVPDRKGDIATGKRTLAVILPDRLVCAIASILLLAASYVASYSGYTALLYIALVSSSLSALSVLLPSVRIILLATKVPILLLTILAAYYYPTYALFIVVLLVLTRIYFKKRFGVAYPQIN